MSSSSSQPQPQQSIATEDMISTLPDSILSHILSFLPTKYAAATRVLSKRWNPLYPLWLSILTLDFDVQSFEDLNTFLHAVYPNMLPIQRFINAAIQRGIENLTFEKVYELKLTRGILSVNLRCPHLLYIVHTFHDLTQIELFFLSYKGKIWSEKWRWMLEVLQQSPKLQHLAIHQEMENVGIYEANWEDPQIIPHCLSSQLKTCLFRDFRGTKNEIQFAEYVMQNSKALCTMTIHSVCSIDLNAKYQMLQKLSVCPRDCELLFD